MNEVLFSKIQRMNHPVASCRVSNINAPSLVADPVLLGSGDGRG